MGKFKHSFECNLELSRANTSTAGLNEKHAIVSAQANTGAAMEDNMARRRYQRGSVFLRGKREQVWVGRWREDIIDQSGQCLRMQRKEVLGTKRDFPTRKLALRELETRLLPINSLNYRVLRRATFGQFAEEWKTKVLTNHKPATQSAIRSQLKTAIVFHLGQFEMKDITARTIQSFIHACEGKAPKTIKNYILTLHMMWKQAKAWAYVNHDPFEGLVLPRITRQRRFFFTLEEVKTIINAAAEPEKTLYWLAAETGLRAGELFGLRVEDLDLERATATVRQSVWNRKVQSPKSDHANRAFALSPDLAEQLRVFLSKWRPNPLRLLFTSQTGAPLDRSNFVTHKLWPLLDSLKIPHCGLHAFRHTNGSLMDQIGAPMKLRQERLGHAPGSEITMAVYTHVIGDDDRRVAVQLGEMLRPDVPKFDLAKMQTHGTQ